MSLMPDPPDASAFTAALLKTCIWQKSQSQSQQQQQQNMLGFHEIYILNDLVSCSEH